MSPLRPSSRGSLAVEAFVPTQCLCLLAMVVLTLAVISGLPVSTHGRPNHKGTPRPISLDRLQTRLLLARSTSTAPTVGHALGTGDNSNSTTTTTFSSTRFRPYQAIDACESSMNNLYALWENSDATLVNCYEVGDAACMAYQCTQQLPELNAQLSSATGSGGVCSQPTSADTALVSQVQSLQYQESQVCVDLGYGSGGGRLPSYTTPIVISDWSFWSVSCDDNRYCFDKEAYTGVTVAVILTTSVAVVGAGTWWWFQQLPELLRPGTSAYVAVTEQVKACSTAVHSLVGQLSFGSLTWAIPSVTALSLLLALPLYVEGAAAPQTGMSALSALIYTSATVFLYTESLTLVLKSRLSLLALKTSYRLCVLSAILSVSAEAYAIAMTKYCANGSCSPSFVSSSQEAVRITEFTVLFLVAALVVLDTGAALVMWERVMWGMKEKGPSATDFSGPRINTEPVPVAVVPEHHVELQQIDEA